MAWMMVAATRAATAESPRSFWGSMRVRPAFSTTDRKAGEGLLVDVVLGQTQHGDFAFASGQGLDHRLGLPDAQIEPVGADERQPLAVRGVGVHADHRDARLDQPC